MNSSQRRIAVYILAGLLTAYVAPLLIAAGASAVGTLNGQGGPGKFLLQLMTGGGPYAQASAIIAPLIAGLTVAALWSDDYRTWTYAVVVLAVVGVLSSVFLWYDLAGDGAEPMFYYAPTGYDENAAFKDMKEKFLGSVIGTLATVVAVLLGIKAADVRPANANE